MRYKNRTYYIVNVIVALMCIMLFRLNYLNVLSFLKQIDAVKYLIIGITMFFVIAVKYIRIYLIFYGTGLSLGTHTKLFFKTTIVNILIPFKLGDLFRGYCYGQKLKNYIQGFCYILLDRFMDTLALVTLVMLFSIINKMSLSTVLYIMVVFLVVLIVAYFTFPKLFVYWNTYFIKETATTNKLRALNVLNNIDKVYGTLKEHIIGRGVILYILSLFAWTIEGMGFFGIRYYDSGAISLIDISKYLGAALGIGTLDYQKMFIITSMIMSIMAYVIYSAYILIKKQGEK